MDQSSVLWRAPGAPAVRIERQVMEGIAAEIRQANAQGSEASGILAGRREAGEVIIEDFEPVPENDQQGLRESLEWFGPRVLGYYCGHMGEGFSFDARKRELIDRHFPGTQPLFLLLKPVRAGILADFFLRREGSLRPARHAVPFPFENQAPPRLVLPPRPAVPPRPSRALPWAAVGVLAATAVAGLLGYRSVRPTPAPAQAPVTLAAAHAPEAAPLPVAVPAPTGVADRSVPEPQPAASDQDQIRAVLDQWAEAQRRGNPRAVTACYTPRASRTARPRRDKLAVLRLDDIHIERSGSRRANVTFRKHWQTTGVKPLAGEQDERLGFVKGTDGWKIDSAEELRVYWTRPQ